MSETQSNRERLIYAGIEEIAEVGFEKFSTRSVAKRCGLSYNAPYKHFKNTEEFLTEIFGYINLLFLREQEKYLSTHADATTREKLVALSMLYIRFLVEHPDFQKIILQNFKSDNKDYRCLQGQLSLSTNRLVEQYCDQVGMPPEVKHKKLFAVRSFIYSSSFFFANGQLVFNEDNLTMVRSLIEREFEIQ